MLQTTLSKASVAVWRYMLRSYTRLGTCIQYEQEVIVVDFGFAPCHRERHSSSKPAIRPEVRDDAVQNSSASFFLFGRVYPLSGVCVFDLNSNTICLRYVYFPIKGG